MICIYVSTYDLNKCPLLSCFICLMNFELEIWRLQNWWGIMLPYLWWLHKGGSLLVRWWCHQTGGPSVFPVEDCRCWDQQSPCSSSCVVWGKGFSPRRSVMGTRKKNSANGKGIQLWRLLTLVFILGILITGLPPFFLSTKGYHWIIMKYYEVFEDDITSTTFNR